MDPITESVVSDAGNSEPTGTIAGGIEGFIDPKLAGRNRDSGNDAGTRTLDADADAPYGRKSDGTPKRKRGRKPGSGSGGTSKRSVAKASDSNLGLEKILFSIHTMAASFFSRPELMIDQAEAKMLGEAINDVQEYYEIEATQEVIIWTNLIGAIVAIYGPRVFVMINSRKTQSRQKAQPVTEPPKQSGPSALDVIMNPEKYRNG